MRLDRPVTQFVQPEQESMTTLSLWKNSSDSSVRNANLAELAWRIALPVSVILLSLLAFSLSEVKPRQGRYAKLFPAVLIYTVYANLIFINRSWMTRGVISPELGMWWPHALLALITALLLYITYHPHLIQRIKNASFTTLSH